LCSGQSLRTRPEGDKNKIKYKEKENVSPGAAEASCSSAREKKRGCRGVDLFSQIIIQKNLPTTDQPTERERVDIPIFFFMKIFLSLFKKNISMNSIHSDRKFAVGSFSDFLSISVFTLRLI